MKILFIIGLLLCSSIAGATSPAIESLKWQLKKDASGVQIYSAKVSGSPYRAILAETLVNAPVEQLVDILRMPETCTQWVYRCKDSYVVKNVSQNTDLVYTSTNMPFPAKDRDILAEITWQTDPNTQIVRAIGMATKNPLAPASEKIRIEDAQMIWELTPIGNGKTKISNYAHINPAGGLPPWLINQLSVNVPLKTLKGLKALVLAMNPIS